MKITRSQFLILFLGALSVFIGTEVQAIVPTITEVKDTRTTGKFFAGCEIELTLVGDEMSDVTHIRQKINSALDDSGRDLRKDEQNDSDFSEVTQYSGNKITLKLKNPSRKAATIKEIIGEIEFYIPKLDPQSTIEIPNALSLSGKKLSNPALAQNSIQITLFTASDYAAYRKAEAEKQAAAQGIQNSVANMLGGMLGGNSGNEITFLIEDPKQRLIGFNFYTSSGSLLKSNGSMTSRGSQTVKTLSYSQALPADGLLKIAILTDKALQKVPLKLNEIALP